MELVEAQDYILGVLGSAPTGDITSLNPDAQTARGAIARLKKSLQKRGWWFNTNRNIEHTPATGDKEIVLPANVIKIVPIYTTQQRIVQRGIKLYDSYNNTYQFTESVTTHDILDLEWDLLPTDAQETIVYKAASELCSSELEDEIKADAQLRLAQAAELELKRAHLKVSKQNALNSPHALRFRSGIRPYKR